MNDVIKKRRPMSDETKAKISAACRGRKSPNHWLGKKFTDTHKSNLSKSISESLKMHPKLVNENSKMWKGNDAGYRPKHVWVARRLGRPMFCWDCGVNGGNPNFFHWANISGEYKRDLDDWVRLCAGCHKNYDMGKKVLTLNYKVRGE